MILRAKLHYEIKSDYIDRRRLRNWMDLQVKRHPAQLLYGYCGMGKSSAVVNYLQTNYKNRYAYYQLDAGDNDPAQFLSYFDAMIADVGCSDAPLDANPSSHVMHFLGWCEQEQHGDSRENVCALVFDHVEVITNEDILAAMRLLMIYAGSQCILFFLSDHDLSDFWKQQAAEGHIHYMDSGQFAWNSTELRAYYRSKRLDLTERLQTSLLQISGGVPGLLEHILEKLEGDQTGRISDQSKYILEVNDWIYRNLWRNLSEQQIRILYSACVFPYIDEDFCRQMLGIPHPEEEILWLKNLGLLRYDDLRHVYQLQNMMDGYIHRTRLDHFTCWAGEEEISRQREKIWKAIRWYEGRKQYREAYLSLIFSIEIMDPDTVTDFICRHVRDIVLSVNCEQLAKGVTHISQEGEHRPEILFLRGILEIYRGSSNEDKRYQSQLAALLEEERDDHQKIAELYLNLRYMDSDTDITQWLDLAENVRKNDEKIAIYSMTAGGFSLCFGYKDMSPCFLGDLKSQRAYKRKWEKILCEDQQDCFDLAEAEFWLATNREKQAEKRLNEILTRQKQSTDRNILLCIYSLLCMIYRQGLGQTLYEQNEEAFLREIRTRYDTVHFIGALAYRNVYTGYRGDQDGLIRWFREEEQTHLNQLFHENACIYRLRAKKWTEDHQYSQAMEYWQIVEQIYDRRRNDYRHAECLFGQAVCLYETGRKSDALKIATRALTIGVKYRYVGLYSEYGKTGYELIKMNQNMIRGGIGRSERKKRYYYGNIMRSTFEEYEEILLRVARRSARKTSSSHELEQDRLTVMELAVLRCAERGLSNQEIAEEMNIKITTVKTHMSAIFRKLDVKNRQTAVKLAKENLIL